MEEFLTASSPTTHSLATPFLFTMRYEIKEHERLLNALFIVDFCFKCPMDVGRTLNHVNHCFSAILLFF